MQVRDIMTDHVYTVTKTMSLWEAAKRMRSRDIGALIVVDEHRPIGIVTDRDLVTRALALRKSGRTTRVEEVCSAPLITCREETSVSEAARLMGRKHVRRLVVLNKHHEAVGILSLGDMIQRTDNEELAATLLAAVSRPAGE